MQKVNIPTLECLRCGHRWHPKKEELPKCCGFCKTPYWNVPPQEGSAARRRHELECAHCRAEPA